MKSQYIQRKRTKGFNLQAASPDGRPVVSCTRPSPWGNPYRYDDPRASVRDYYEAMVNRKVPGYDEQGRSILVPFYVKARVRQELAGKHLSCWCALGTPCHVQDVLLPILNGEEPRTYKV